MKIRKECHFLQFLQGRKNPVTVSSCGYSISTRLKPLMHGQANLIKFVESNKIDNVYSQIKTFLFDQMILI